MQKTTDVYHRYQRLHAFNFQEQKTHDQSKGQHQTWFSDKQIQKLQISLNFTNSETKQMLSFSSVRK